jgi:hypothetical protein
LDDETIGLSELATCSSQISPNPVRSGSSYVSLESVTIIERRAISRIDHVQGTTLIVLDGCLDATHASCYASELEEVVVPGAIVRDINDKISNVAEGDGRDIVLSIYCVFV